MNKTRLPYLAAPLLISVYGLVRLLDGLDGRHGPGVLWVLGHLAFLVSIVLFVPVLRGLREAATAGGGTASRVVATGATVVGLAGAAAAFVQIAIDIWVGATAADADEMSRMFDRVQSVPGVQAIVYGPGPALFYLGLLALLVGCAVARAIPVWTPAVALAGVVASLASLDLLPLTGALVLVPLLPLWHAGFRADAGALPARGRA
ncbi:hypothetical protein [Actinomadura harenae]|uniref:DUF4386 family protein n=1 Tax=Actinomadura harenae TaxID=2483351 RepID=A0A3M2LHN9_9ACTN|nr:hypothetical protein [Actinomadura harenae]RMI36951.1 hypothetical protein EBO15_37135 [Actinomadura harenae]